MGLSLCSLIPKPNQLIAVCARCLRTFARTTLPIMPPPPRLALETTLLTHGVPRACALPLALELAGLARAHGCEPALMGVLRGQPIAGMTETQLAQLLDEPSVEKINTSSLAAAIALGRSGATTVSTTIELAAGCGCRVFATGGIGGVHKDLSAVLDISTDLIALTRWPVAVVTAGCKSILDVRGTRELLETLGVPVIGYQSARFSAFYQRDGGTDTDARFDDIAPLARFVRATLAHSNRGIIIANPIPHEHEINADDWARWLAAAEAKARSSGATGRGVTPGVLAALHDVSAGRTLSANIALVKHNVQVGAMLAAAIQN